MKHIVVTGNPVDGFAYIGPFATVGEAEQHAADRLTEDWWVAVLNAPEGVEEDPADFYSNRPADWVKETHLRLGKALDDLGDANARIRQLEEDLQTSNRVIDRMAAGLGSVKIAAEEAMGTKNRWPERFEDFFLDA